ncbi:putative aminoacyl-tRNA hydrolase [Viridothelium virens]|uniref:D-aminoacyl-tRNA deacylase n=1 Tax=Viridothelium virens TaxID=1048519 RepID=A0A6A6HE49_VIRVR|nr:putative aminoacyl-tRNA hydrolase [Viridothelium virens]
MKAILQRVKSASVTVDEKLVSSIGKGLLVFAAVAKDDTEKEADGMASKILKTKLWDDENGGRWKKNVQDIQGEILCVSQFTLYATTKKGNKPDFHKSASGSKAKVLYDHFFAKVEEAYSKEKVKNGVFQAMMDVGLVNDGPVTIEINTDPPKDFVDVPEPEEGGVAGTYSNSKGESGEIHKSFTIPAELLE